ncbi:MAG: hypothetical protein N3B21_08880 [Clostridia bacterium]|nr:hypothetical protein [Clostridia bacterium]
MNDAAKFIEHVEDISQKLDELIKMSPKTKKIDYHNHLPILIQQLKTSPVNELADMHNGLKEVAGWLELPLRIEYVKEKVIIATASEPIKSPNIVTTQANCTLGDCPDGPSLEQVDNLLIAAAAADLATAIAQATADTIAIFFEKAGKIAQAIASGLDVVGKGLALAAAIQQRAYDIVAECEDQAVKRLLLSMCNTINSIDTKLDIVINKLEIIDNKLDYLIKLAQEIKEVVDEILLHQIEEALAECKMLVSLYLPEDTYGSILTVQNIVRKLIDYSKVSGIIVANAESYWTQGSIALSKGENIKALEWFMLAYKQLQNKNMCSVPCPSNPCR